MSVSKPTFIIGPHRSGTTLLYEILGRHPDVGYYNRQNRHTPNWPRLAALHTRLGALDKPMEAQNVWDRFRDGSDDGMDESDASELVVNWYHKNISSVLKTRDATRFLAKYPRLSMRLPWIDAVFPDALIIHMQRDWRAVINSTSSRIRKRLDRGGGWFGVKIPGREELTGLPPEIIAGKIFRTVTREIEKQRPRFGDRCLALSYEELCTKPEETIRAIAEHCQWRWTPEFENSIPQDLRISDKWRRQLDPEMIQRIRAEDPELFARYEFAETESGAA